MAADSQVDGGLDGVEDRPGWAWSDAAALGSLGVVQALMAAWTWRRWPDALVDFGSQLYVPWRLTQGDVLYRDLNYLPGGPLSQLFHAGLFNLFGVSFQTLINSNLVLVALLVTLVYRSFARVSSRRTGWILGMTVLLAFAFQQLSDVGNYNYVTPYCAEAFHGFVLAVLGVVCLTRWLQSRGNHWAAGVGLTWGLTFLTKPEIFVALSLVHGSGLGLYRAVQGSWRGLGAAVWRMALAAMLPVLAMAGYFLRNEGWEASVRSVAWAWVPLLTTGAARSPYYAWCMGLDYPAVHARVMGLHFLVGAAVVAGLAGLFRYRVLTSRGRLLRVGVVAVLLAGVSAVNWLSVGASMPCWTLLHGLLLVQQARTKGLRQVLFPLVWTVFSAGLLVKLGLFSRIWHYGFILGMPAFLGCAYLFLVTLPEWLRERGVDRAWFRGVMCVVWAMILLQIVLMSQGMYRQKTVPLGEGPDRLYTFAGNSDYPAGAAMGEAVRWLNAHVPPDATLAVVPEGVTLNYLTRRWNPTGCLGWSPPEMAAFGPAASVAAFQRHPPDYIVIIHRYAIEYGEGFFGTNPRFGQDLMRWIAANYETVFLVGEEPLKRGFGLKIVKVQGPRAESAAGERR